MIIATATLRGTIYATAVIFSSGGVICADATAVLKNTDGDTLSTTEIASGASADITAPDVTVHNSDNTFSVQVASGGDLELEDTTFIMRINGNIVGQTTFPSMVDQVLNVNFVP